MNSTPDDPERDDPADESPAANSPAADNLGDDVPASQGDESPPAPGDAAPDAAAPPPVPQSPADVPPIVSPPPAWSPASETLATSPYGPGIGAEPHPDTPVPPAPPKPQGPSIGVGITSGCALQVVALAIFIGMLSMMMTTGLWGALWAFILIPVVAIGLMFVKSLRRFATGILIVSAATWLVVLGPCIALMGGFTV